jgi:aldehyde:ferredoxin oxidoreductase
MGKMLTVDLTAGKVGTSETLDQDYAKYLGGKGMGTRMLYDMTKPGMDPFSPEMPLIFTTGPVTGTAAPQSNRFNVTTRSPLTGAIANATCGGDFATKIKKAGYDGVVVTGRAQKPVYIEVNEDRVEIKDASHLWGKGTVATQKAMPKGSGNAVIGPAGENKVLYAAIVSGDRVAGRTGVGAVMGSKNLKAISATGNKKVEIMNEPEFREFQKYMVKFLKDHPMTGGILPRLGTANIVAITTGRNIIPTYNFQKGHDPQCVNITGEEMTAKHLEKQGGCMACPIRCGREVKYRGEVVKGPEYETLGLLGSNIGAFNLNDVFDFNLLADDLGMDTISLGGSIGFAMELNEKGLWKNGLKWGDAPRIHDLINEIAHRQGIGGDIADGTKRMAERHGGKEFAINVKGLELAAYDPRGCWGQGLEYATTNRGGCHINGATMFLEATGPFTINPHSTKSKPALVVLQQNTALAINSTILCQFSAYAMIPGAAWRMNHNGAVYKALSSLVLNSGPILKMTLKGKMPLTLLWFEKYLTYIFGRKFTFGDYAEVGARAFQMERMYNCREGFSRKDDNLPDRLLNESTFKDLQKGVPLGEMIDEYYQIRGWDSNGIPTQKELDRLGIRA